MGVSNRQKNTAIHKDYFFTWYIELKSISASFNASALNLQANSCAYS